jgi:16S rRNA (adenine1518-N6/adenine1519-N6)-dimethyltransferase
MNFFDPVSIKNFLISSGLKPKHYLGQNFLIDEMALDEIVDAAEIKKTDLVLEVGPGLGVLTQKLAERAPKVITVEKDATLLPLLKKTLREYENVEIVHQDILKYNLSREVSGKYKVVANIPYYLTSHLFQYMIGQENKPERMILMVQKEVGERVVAGPGELSILGISVQMFADAEIILHVPKTSFWPMPKVDSVVLRIVPLKKFPQLKDERALFRTVKIAFAGKRKQIHNTLVSGFHLKPEKIKSILHACGISEQSRPQELTLEQWVKLSQEIQNESKK